MDDFRDTTTESARGTLTLLALRGVGPQTADRAIAAHRTLGDVLAGAAKNGDGRGLPADASLWEHAHRTAGEQLARALDLGVRVLVPGDLEYPSLLKRIPDRPPALYVKGTLSSLSRAVACIGTREPSHFGEAVTERLVEVLVGARWSIVSGLALGVDTLAHRAALKSGGCTVAVLANGLDSVYPRKNAELAQEVLDAGGALVSEQPLGARAVSWNLVSRDRLQSGMSTATFVMQTDIVGGSMHTVRFTLLQGRLLFAPLPSGKHADEPKSNGILALTTKTGIEVARLVGATPEYAALLERSFPSSPAAIPLASKDDYPRMLQLLEERLATSAVIPPQRQHALF